ncbi:MAG: murein L,D-transpeptidase catalytic domain family protein [Novosphingobium sp.]|nr:murein L,D-transpeptidase catalytic domain family protein [Novosphingobium sp.]
MILNRRHFIGALAVSAAGLSTPLARAMPRPGEASPLLDQARAALVTHGSRIRSRDRVGLVDFSVHSREPRFRIVDLGNGRILADYLVAHGRGSDPANTGFLQKFSNRPGSNASSQGSFLVADTYYGKHGRSRRLQGLDPENDLAFERAIVIHGANYVSSNMARSSGRVGRSQGCFAVSQSDLNEVLALLDPGTLLVSAK